MTLSLKFPSVRNLNRCLDWLKTNEHEAIWNSEQCIAFTDVGEDVREMYVVVSIAKLCEAIVHVLGPDGKFMYDNVNPIVLYHIWCLSKDQLFDLRKLIDGSSLKKRDFLYSDSNCSIFILIDHNYAIGAEIERRIEEFGGYHQKLEI